MISPALFSSAKEEWATPIDLFAKLNQEFGFVLDAAALPENAKCVNFYSPVENGLEKPWARSTWLNPPYGRTIDRWVAKASIEANLGNTVVCLLPARTDTRWWHRYIWDHDRPRPGVEVRLIQGRLKFGDSKNSAPFPSAIVIFRGK